MNFPAHYISEDKKEAKALESCIQQLYHPAEISGSSGNIFICSPISDRNESRRILARRLTESIWNSESFEDIKAVSEEKPTVGTMIDHMIYR
jgi:hypothetical protein